jgi:PAS domain S-box-containing protein
MRALSSLFFLLAMGFIAPAQAETPLEDWRTEINRVRSLAENDIPYAYREAQRLQAAMPASASAADQTRMLNLLTRIEVYLGDTRLAERHAQEAHALAKKNNDRIGQVEADLSVALNAVNQGRFDVMSEAVKHAMVTVDGLDRPDLMGEAMLRTSMMYRRFGRMDDSIEVAMKALAIAKRSHNAFAQAYAYQGIAIAYSLSMRKADSREYYRLMRDAAQQAHSRLLEGDALIGLGSALTGAGDIKGGERLIAEGLALYRKAGGPLYIAHAQHALAENLRQQRKYVEAQKMLDESIVTYQARFNRVGLWWSLRLRSELHRQRGDAAGSDADSEQAYKLAREIGHPYYLSESARTLATHAAGRGDFKRAYGFFAEAAEMQARNERETASARMLDLAKRFEDEADKREIEELTRRNEIQTVQHYWLWTILIASLTLLVLTAIFLLRLRRSREEIRALNISLEQRVAERTAALQRSQQSLAEAQRIASLGSWELDIPGNILTWSEEVYRIFGIDPQGFGNTLEAFFEAVHPEDRNRVEQAYQASLHEIRSYEIEHRILCPDGRVKHVHERCETFFDSDGRPLRSIGTVQDITERKLMEEALAARERNFRSLTENLPDNIARWDTEARYLYINPTHARTLGIAASDIVGKALPETHDRVRAAIAQVVATGQAIALVRQPVLVDGETQIHEVSLAPEYDAAGRIVSVVGLGRNMTKIHRMQEAIAAREQEFRSLAESSPDNIVRFDKEGRYRYLNPRLLKQMGVADMNALIGQRPREVWPDGRFAAIDEAAAQAIASGSMQLVELARLGANGEMAFSHIYVVPERDAAGEIVGTLAFGRDITERKLVEEKLKKALEFTEGIINAIPDILFEVNRDGRYLNVWTQNPELLAAQKDMLLGKTAAEVLSPENAAAAMAAIREADEKGVSRIEDIGIELPQGLRWFSHSLSKKPGSASDEATFLVLSRDITARKEAEQKLKEALEFSEGIVHAIPDLLFELDGDGRYLNIWAHSPELLAAQKEALLGNTVRDVLSPESAAITMEALREAAEREVSFGKTICIDLPQGESWFELSVSKKPGAQTFLVLSRDITGRKRMEDKLAVREQEFRALAENSPDTIARYTHGGIRTYINPLFAKLAGKPTQEMLGVTAVDYQATPQAQAYHNALLHSLETGEEGECEYTWPTHDGSLLTSHIRIVPEFGPDGKVASVLAVGRDISARRRMEAALSESEARLRALIDNLPFEFWAMDNSMRYIMQNSVSLKHYGNVVGKQISDLGLPPEVAEVWMAQDREVLAGKILHEEYGKEVAGELRYFESYTAPVVLCDTVIGIVGVGIDITARKQLEAALKESEARYRYHFNQLQSMLESASSVSVFALDREYRYLFFNNRHRMGAKRIRGSDIEIGMSMVDSIPDPEFREFCRRGFDRVLAGHSVAVESKEALIKDGVQTFEYNDNFGSPIYNDKGEVVGLTVFAINTTERKRLEAELQASRNFLDSVIDSVSDPIFVKDRQHRWTLLNEAFCAFIGRPRDKLLGKSDYDFFPKAEAQVFWEKDELVFESGAVNLNEESFTSADGVAHFIQTKKTPFVSAEGEQMLVGVIRDITERKQFEVAREAALMEAQRLAKVRSDFIAHMSHELRTPLNGILGYAQMLGRDDRLGEKQLASVDVIRHSGEHLLSLIEDILDLARIESGKLELHVGDIPLRHFLQVIERMIAIRAREKDLECVCEFAPDLPEGIRGDEKRLRQVLLNLLSNAVKFTERGRVTLSVNRVAPSRLAFAVTDTGVGITAPDQEQLFQPFGQVGDAQQRAEGTGLGLAISRQLVRLMGGDITVKSRPGDGSTFRFELDLPEVGISPAAAKHTGKTAHGRHTGATEPALPMVAPPEAEMRELHRLALLGNMRDIADYAERIGKLDPRYLPFTAQLKQLAQALKSKALLAFVERHLT